MENTLHHFYSRSGGWEWFWLDKGPEVVTYLRLLEEKFQRSVSSVSIRVALSNSDATALKRSTC